jgi:hypothetical protein
MAGESKRTTIIETEIGDIRPSKRSNYEQDDPEGSLSKEELRVLDDSDKFSILDLDESTLDPERHYRWGRADPNRIARLKAKGYIIEEVPEEEDQRIRNKLGEVAGDTTDGTYRLGDLILMSTKKVYNRVRRVRVRRLTKERIGEAKKKFKKLARKARVEVITDKED